MVKSLEKNGYEKIQCIHWFGVLCYTDHSPLLDFCVFLEIHRHC